MVQRGSQVIKVLAFHVAKPSSIPGTPEISGCSPGCSQPAPGGLANLVRSSHHHSKLGCLQMNPAPNWPGTTRKEPPASEASLATLTPPPTTKFKKSQT